MPTPEERQVKDWTPEQVQAEFRLRLGLMDQLEPSVPIKLRGNDYTLEYDNRAVREIFKASRPTLNLLTQSLTTELEDPDTVSLLLYWGLKRHHPDMTQDEADGLWGPRQRLYVQQFISLALQLFLPNLDGLPLAKKEGISLVDKEDKGDPLSKASENGSGTGPEQIDSEYMGSDSGAQA